jgi:hypothetical protein
LENEEGENWSVLLKVSVVVCIRIDQEKMHFSSTMATGRSRKGECIKKKIQGFPHVFYIENFKTALMGDMKLWSSRRYRHRRHRHRRHRRRRSKVEKKRAGCKRQKVGHGKKDKKINKKNKVRRRRGITVHWSFYRVRVVRGAKLESMEN